MKFSTNTRLDQFVRNMQSEVTWHNYRNGFTRLKFLKNVHGQHFTEVQHEWLDTFYLDFTLFNEDLRLEI